MSPDALRRPTVPAAVLTVLATLVGGPLPPAAATPTGTPQSIAIPSYFEPDFTGSTASACGSAPAGPWAQVESAAPTARLAIINPIDGPGSAIDHDYRCQTLRSQQAGLDVLGYVETWYTDRPPADVKLDIDRYYSWYGVDGIFLDETTAGCGSPADVAYYQDLYDYVKAKGTGPRVVIQNPGTMPQGDCYMPSSDVIVLFESSYSSYVAAAQPPAWTQAYDPSRFWDLVYATSSSQWADALARSEQRRVGWVYVTHDVEPNPWDTVASYWSQEVAQLPRLFRWRASNDATTTTFSYYFNAPSTWRRVYVDEDRSAATGFQHGGVGAGYLLEDDRLYRYTGTGGQDWNWTEIRQVTPVTGPDRAAWTVLRSDIGETGFPGSSDVVFENELDGGPRSTSPRYTHTYSDATGPITSYVAENDLDTVYYEAAFQAAYDYTHVFVDTDVSGATGYSYGGVGADYMIENSTLYDYIGPEGGTTWLWAPLTGVDRTVTGAVQSWSVARATLGETAASGERTRLVFHGLEESTGTEHATPPYLHEFSEPAGSTPDGQVLVGAGDIADCTVEGDAATANLLDRISGTVYTTGDNAYPSGTASEYTDCYGPTWGRHKARTRPSPGNHEYVTTGAAGYFGYFGAAAGDPAKGYYSYDLGEWHVVAINSNCGHVGGCGAGSAQEQWLRQDLAASTKACTVAYWHHPLFTSGANHGPAVGMRPIFQALHDFGAEVVLTGHNHQYERFAPQDPNGGLDLAGGIRQFVVGTGGRSHYGFGTVQPNSEARNADTFGVLSLTLRPGGYDFEFVPEDGRTFRDSGSGTCH